jgi:hypothetical protein
MIENRYAALSQELVDKECMVRRSIIVQQLPLSSPVQLQPNTVDVSQQPLQNFLVECGIHGLTCRNEFFMDDAIAFEEGNQHCLDLGRLQAILFGLRGRR